jgi:SAM-dependent methyltransferase
MNVDAEMSSQITQHYLVEKELARRLMSASKSERRILYTKLYDEMFQRVPYHPMLVEKASKGSREKVVSEHLKLVGPYLKQTTCYMELGPGDCALAFRIADQVKEVVAIDVSLEITRNANCPSNFRLIVSDGCSIPVPEGSIDFAFSNQLMEHLHPDDAMEQLSNIVRALAVGGSYMCITPNRLSGPHDVSKGFEDIAAGFHLREYTSRELIQLFSSAGLKDIKLFLRIKGNYINLPVWVFTCSERLVSWLPSRQRRRISWSFPLRTIMNCIYIIGFKR